VRHNKQITIPFDDEYDLQDAVHSILRLHFEEVVPEEWTPSYAGSASRMDFLLKREKVAIELKMTRKSLGQREVVSQLIEDKERYRTHPDCRVLVCFVFDPDGYCDNPSVIESDVSESGHEFRVLVVVFPSGT
jgi:hypothetical protein